MLVPISLIIIVLAAAALGGLYLAKRRVVDGDRKPDVRPDDPRPNPGLPMRH